MISKLLPVKYGIPQGSCLAPLLFLLYINDLPNASKFDTSLLFVDDTLLLLANKNLILLKQKVNEPIKNINLWLRINKLSLNYAKTNFIVFHKQPQKNFLMISTYI